MSFILLLVRFTLLFILVGVTAQAQDLLNGLIVHYPMNGNALDVGPNGFHGSVNGAILGPDQDGNANSAYYFDGVNDFVDFPIDPLLKPQFPFTVACVVRYDNVQILDDAHVFTTDFSENNYCGAFSSIVGDRQTISFGGSAGNTNPSSRRTKTGTSILNSMQWYRITFIVRGSSDMEIYLDCINDGGTYSGTGPTAIQYSNIPGCLGRMDTDFSGPSNYFKGAISDFRMWNRELTELEITYMCDQPCFSQVSPNDTICVGESTLMTAQTTVFNGWADATAPNLILSMDTFLTVSPLETTLYLAYSDCGTDSVTIQVDTVVQLDLGSDTLLCPEQTLVLGNGASTYPFQWQDGSIGNSFLVESEGSFWATYSNACGTDKDTIDITYSDYALDLGPDVELCLGEDLELMADSISPIILLWSDGSANASFTVDTSGTYWISVTVDGCVFLDSISAVFNDTPSVDLGPDMLLCNGESAFLEVDVPNAEIVWMDNLTQLVLSVSATGEYWASVTVSGCPSVYDTISVEAISVIVDIGDDAVLCQGDTVAFDVEVPGGQYLWENGSTSPMRQVSVGGEYAVEVSVQGCVSVDTVNLTFNTAVAVDLGGDTTLCPEAQMVLEVEPGIAEVLWSDGQSDSLMNVNSEGIYWVSLQVDGCEPVVDSVIVAIWPVVTVDLGPDQTICSGDTVELYPQLTGSMDYLWNTGDVTPSLTVSSASEFWLAVTNNGCTFSDTVEIFLQPLPEVFLGPDSTHCFAEPFRLWANVSASATLVWNDGSTADTLMALDAGQYFIDVLLNGCAASDTIVLESDPCALDFTMPNVFTPNGDGLNDTFRPDSLANASRIGIWIYNRWGLLLFETDNLAGGWDGRTSLGAEVPVGTYFWIIEVISFEGIENRSHGYLTLLR